ncbi:hypothetical protein [Yersinia massiliensis]|uniref:hypothetical protein n=1 Tax=Yersinia massiliensis TaxID=419257 RepID=UPI0011A2B5A6|nr:hypothetical protein [Yersinia massiliensis]
MHAQNQEALSENSCQRLPQSPPRACSARGRSRHIAPLVGAYWLARLMWKTVTTVALVSAVGFKSV